mmetsp:Transcript_11050/g.28747  ORF Transcript_11050/g.28747 Transcript_11050/m.28747 type:complete len:101 (+) Transcript_11050:105-407(+)
MFHDIVNKRVGLRNVPRFWQEIKEGAWRVPGVYDFEAINCTYQPRLSDQQMMGIGLLRIHTPIPVPGSLLNQVFAAGPGGSNPRPLLQRIQAQAIALAGG